MSTTDAIEARQKRKSETAFRTISEVAEELDVAQHVLRFWESKFAQVRPLKRGGGRRYYRPEDVGVLKEIRTLLYDQGYTIKGAQKLLRERRTRLLPPRVPPRADAPVEAEEPLAEEAEEDAPGPDGARLLALRRRLTEARDLLLKAGGEPSPGRSTIDPTDPDDGLG